MLLSSYKAIISMSPRWKILHKKSFKLGYACGICCHIIKAFKLIVAHVLQCLESRTRYLLKLQHYFSNSLCSSVVKL